jgi:outer membrane protein OmpA-like peptidoglycan-associated protein
VYGDERDTTHYRGYAFSMATRVILEELKRQGRAEVAVLVPEVTPRTPYRGTLARTGQATEAFPVLLDGRRVSLPGIRVKGVLRNPTASEPELRMEFLFLDDPDAAWYLYSRMENPAGLGGRKLLVRIATNAAQQELANDLRTRCAAEVGDIHFASGSADVDSASVPAFQRIAAVLKDNPAWQLILIGHTDSIGSAAANLELSRRRTAAVREILVRDHRVSASRLVADGKGEVSPLEDNGSPAGRARNRRVELKRRCD